MRNKKIRAVTVVTIGFDSTALTVTTGFAGKAGASMATGVGVIDRTVSARAGIFFAAGLADETVFVAGAGDLFVDFNFLDALMMCLLMRDGPRIQREP